MTRLKALIRRNILMFFKDKGLLFTSLITPVILLVLYATFLGKVYRDSFVMNLPAGIVPEDVINGCVAGQLTSSLLAVCCVTVAFCSNMLMAQDKMTGARRDLVIAPVGGGTLALAYFVSAYISTLCVCLTALAAGLVYTVFQGWYLTFGDVMLLTADMMLLALFGAALSSVVNCNLRTQGQISAVGTIVSSGYGFICGAYMPVSQFPLWLQKTVSLLPGTYATSLVRNHAMNGPIGEIVAAGAPDAAIRALREAVDCDIYFFNSPVSVPCMYAVLLGATILITALYVLISRRQSAL